jgi:hypothetical protein
LVRLLASTIEGLDEPQGSACISPCHRLRRLIAKSQQPLERHAKGPSKPLKGREAGIVNLAFNDPMQGTRLNTRSLSSLERVAAKYSRNDQPQPVL